MKLLSIKLGCFKHFFAKTLWDSLELGFVLMLKHKMILVTLLLLLVTAVLVLFINAGNISSTGSTYSLLVCTYVNIAVFIMYIGHS